jgi:predicted kinase
MMPKLIVLVGLPGSGKSTFVKKYADINTFVYSTDDYLECVAKEQNSTYDKIFNDHIMKAIETMDNNLIEAIKSNKDIIWDQTNVAEKKRKIILSQIPKDYVKICVAILPPADDKEWNELNARLASRKGKNIPKEVIKLMFNRFQLPTTKEGFDFVHTSTLNEISDLRILNG